MTSTSPHKRLSPFDFAKSINEKSDNLLHIQPEAEKDYQPFLVNRALSFSSDTVLYANTMNQSPNLDKKLQYDYLFASVRRRKRYDKWIKREEDDLIPLVSKIYEVSPRKAAEYLSMLSEDQKNELRTGYGGS
jgi:hypothetical protein